MRKMVSKEQVLIFLTTIVISVYGALKRNVLYARKGPGVLNKSIDGKRACAAAMWEPSVLAIRIEDTTGVCEGLIWDWGSSRQYEAGYSYYEKKTTLEVYDPALLIGTRKQWILPGRLGGGGRLDIYITPTPNTKTFFIRILNTTQLIFTVNDGVPEDVVVNIAGKKGDDKAYFETYAGQWTFKGMVIPYPFIEGIINKVSVVPDATHLSILFDDLPVVNYTHPADPAESKQLKFNCGAGSNLKLNGIEFYGVER